MGLGDKVGDLGGRDPLGENARRRFVDFQGDVLGTLHERDLGRRFNHPAAGCDQTGIDELEGVAGAAQAVEGEKRRSLVDSHGAMGMAVAAHRIDHQSRGVLVLFPGAHIAVQLQHGPRLLFLEGGTNVGEFAFDGNHGAVQALAGAQTHTGEVVKTGGCVQVEGLHTLVSHQSLRFFDAPKALLGGNGLHAVAHG